MIFKSEKDATTAVAAIVKLDGDDDAAWTYNVVVDPNGSGRAIIEVLDEDGIFLGNL